MLLLPLLLCQKASSICMKDGRFLRIPQDESRKFFKLRRPMPNAFSRESSKGILNKSGSFNVGLVDLIKKAFRIEDDIKIVAFSSDMDLVIPEEQRHQRKSIELKIELFYFSGEFFVIVTHLCWMVSHFFAKILAHSHVLVEFKR